MDSMVKEHKKLRAVLDKAKRKEAFHTLIENRIASADLKPGRFDAEADPRRYKEKQAAYETAGKALQFIFGANLGETELLKKIEETRGNLPAFRLVSTEEKKGQLGKFLGTVFDCQLCNQFEYKTYMSKTGRTARTFCRNCLEAGRVVYVKSSKTYEQAGTGGLVCIHGNEDDPFYEWEDRATLQLPDGRAYQFNRADRNYYHPDLWERNNWHLFPPGSEIIGGYHSSKSLVGHIPSMYDRSIGSRDGSLLLGMELEVELKNQSVNRKGTASEVFKIMGVYKDEKTGKAHRYCATEHDGSLANGFEIVTAYTGLDVHEKQLSALKAEPFKGKLRSHDTTTCGLHVHIDRLDMTPLHAEKLNRFINAKENRALVLAIARRYGEGAGYAIISEKKDGGKAIIRYLKSSVLSSTSHKAAATLFDKRPDGRPRIKLEALRPYYRHAQMNTVDRARYQAINFTNEHTIEYRLFRGTLKFETIMSCLEFTRLTWLFCRDFGITDMTIPKFIEYMMRHQNSIQSKYLRPFLVAKGFVPGATITVKEGVEFKRLTVSTDRAKDERILGGEDAMDGIETKVATRKPRAKSVKQVASFF